MMRRLWGWIGMLMMVALCGCDHRILSFDQEEMGDDVQKLNLQFTYDLSWHENYDAYKDYDVDLGWTEEEVSAKMGGLMENVVPTVPDGIRVQVMKDGGHYLTSNVGASDGSIYLADGDYSLLFYNNNTEAIVFNLDAAEGEVFSITTRTRTRATYEGNPLLTTRTDNTVTEPDVLFFHYQPQYTVDSSQESATLEVEMRPLVFTYVIRFNFVRGMEYVALARGALEGMAESVSLNDGTTSDVEATILYECELTDDGIVAAVKSFGIPSYTPNTQVARLLSRKAYSEGNLYGVTLEVRLVDGSLKTFNFDVTDQVELQPCGGVITLDGIEITEDDLEQSDGSAFWVEIEDWGEYEDITLPLGK